MTNGSYSTKQLETALLLREIDQSNDGALGKSFDGMTQEEIIGAIVLGLDNPELSSGAKSETKHVEAPAKVRPSRKGKKLGKRERYADPKEVGAAIREGMRALNMTDGELASKLGTSFSAVGNWKRGSNLPTAENFQKIAKILNLAIEGDAATQPSA